MINTAHNIHIQSHKYAINPDLLYQRMFLHLMENISHSCLVSKNIYEMAAYLRWHVNGLSIKVQSRRVKFTTITHASIESSLSLSLSLTPLEFFTVGFIPFCSRKTVTSMWPLKAARCNAVLPNSSAVLKLGAPGQES